MIKKDNIEEKFFDYFEGALSADEKGQVERFVNDNPEYQVDFEAWKNSYLPEEKFVYEHVDDLLVSEGGQAKGLFARWKTGLIVLLVSAGVGITVFNKMGRDQVVLADNGSKQGATPVNADRNGNNAAQGVETLSADGAKQLDDVDNTSYNESGNVSGSTSTSNSTYNKVVNRRADKKIAFQNTNANAVVTGKNSGSSSSTRTVDTNGASSVDQSQTASTNGMVAQALSRKDYQQVLIEAERSEIADLLTTPTLKQSRSKFEKYDINELKFVNNKDPYFILPNGVALLRNSSHAGNGEGIRVSYNYNNQWPEISDNYTTQTVSIDGYSSLLKGGLGVVLMNDVLGHNKFTTRSATFIYAPKFLLFGETTIEPSIQLGAVSKTVSWNQVKNDRLYDPRNGMLHLAFDGAIPEIGGSTTEVLPQLGFGLLLNTSKIFVGFSYDQFLNPKYDFSELAEEIYSPGQLNAQVGGSIIPVKDWDSFIITPSINFYKVAGYDEVWLSNVVSISSLFLGASYSLDNEAMFGIGYNNKKIKVSYSYGRTNSPLNNVRSNLNVHQVGVSLSLRKR